MLWRLLIPRAFPEKFISVSLALALHLGEDPRGQAGGAVVTTCPPSLTVPISHVPHPTLSLLPLAFPFVCHITHLGSCDFALSCEWGILLCDQVLSYIFGLWPFPNSSHSVLLCRGCDFFLIRTYLFLTRADCGNCALTHLGVT